MEYTEPKTAEMLSKHNIQEAVIESNNGGRGFARNVGTQCRIMGNNKGVTLKTIPTVGLSSCTKQSKLVRQVNMIPVKKVKPFGPKDTTLRSFSLQESETRMYLNPFISKTRNPLKA